MTELVELGPIEGLTSYWKPLAGEVNVPEAPNLYLRVPVSAGTAVQWDGISESMTQEGHSIATLDLVAGEERTILVHRSQDGDPPTTTMLLARCIPCPPSALTVKHVLVEPVSIDFSEKLGYRSYDKVVAISANSYQACAGKLLEFFAAFAPLALENLLEWRIDGHLLYGHSIIYSFSRPGFHRIYVGPHSAPTVIRVAVYQARLAVPDDTAGIIQQSAGYATIPLRATTIPAGYESDLVWAVDTQHGTADVESTSPGTATLFLNGVVGEGPIGKPHWAIHLACGGAITHFCGGLR